MSAPLTPGATVRTELDGAVGQPAGAGDRAGVRRHYTKRITSAGGWGGAGGWRQAGKAQKKILNFQINRFFGLLSCIILGFHPENGF